ncbi:MAG: hypothetical protein HY282_18670 [Nitrospirae bacterium]|nr:hypothetical protein [Candidatus Manganitrophaceae bacterium]
MKKQRSGRVLLILITLFFVGAGCASMSKEKKNPEVPIGEIQGHPRDWVGKTVQVAGEVKDAYSLVLYKYFILTDGTGEIQVVTSKPLPRKGERLNIQGKVEEGFSFGSESRTILREQG